jgi:hypothetical protein
VVVAVRAADPGEPKGVDTAEGFEVFAVFGWRGQDDVVIHLFVAISERHPDKPEMLPRAAAAFGRDGDPTRSPGSCEDE